jgi:hypothetical protein
VTLLRSKLSSWAQGAPNRSVKLARVAGEHHCECLDHGERMALGVGADEETAVKDACDQLWARSLETTGPASNPNPGWRKH